ncbi:hypothetical protein NL676_038108 [Syzygium grande]|nr:hypothetical protein NL676_038108 [Syzygium grande]
MKREWVRRGMAIVAIEDDFVEVDGVDSAGSYVVVEPVVTEYESQESAEEGRWASAIEVDLWPWWWSSSHMSKKRQVNGVDDVESYAMVESVVSEFNPQDAVDEGRWALAAKAELWPWWWSSSHASKERHLKVL